MELAFLIIKLIFAFLIVFSLMYLVFKLSGDKFSKLNEGKYIKILERTQISKDSSIAVVKVGKKGYVLSTTSNKMEKLDDLTEEEINLLEEGKKEEKERLNQQYDLILDKFKCNINRFKKKITKRKIV